MEIQHEFKGWEHLSLSDLLIAYRKAKSDCFFENTFPASIKFAEFEQDLEDNLNKLLIEIKKRKGFKNITSYLGDCRLVPKKLRKKSKSSNLSGHIHFSNPERAFENLVQNNELVPDFRVVGDFPVEMHIISALWINMIGHKFDSCLSDTCYGARLKRVQGDDVLDREGKRPFHLSAIGSFIPYFQPYKKWRNDGLSAIRGELEKDRNVIAVSLDLKSYYHLIDPTIICSKSLLSFFEPELRLTPEEKIFNQELSSFLKSWSLKAESFVKSMSENSRVKPYGGLAIGLTASRIISNVLLHKWDLLIKEKITPIHYGRYVDDMFLVLRDNGKINSSKDFLQYLKERLGKAGTNQILSNKKDDLWQINLNSGYQNKSLIQLQADKQKLFVLQGRSGIDLLDGIERDIHELSSEYRLMPSPDRLENTTAAGVLSASSSNAEPADTLRRADGLTIRRLSWSLQLSHVETLANDLPKKVWKKERDDFYQFAHNHIVRADGIFEHYTYLPRLLSIAVNLSEWSEAEKIVNQSFTSLDVLKLHTQTNSVYINGKKFRPKDTVWDQVAGSLAWAFIDSAARSYNPSLITEDSKPKSVSKMATTFLVRLNSAIESSKLIFGSELGVEEFYNKAPLLTASDLGKLPYKKFIANHSLSLILNKFDEKADRHLLSLMAETNVVDSEILLDFLKKTKVKRLSNTKTNEDKSKESYRPYLFPTRPYTPDEISELEPSCVGLTESNEKPPVIWAKYVKALRGTWVKPTLLAMEQQKDFSEFQENDKTVLISKIGNQKKRTVIVTISSFYTPDRNWSASASGKSELSLDRYKRISELVNTAVKLVPKPDYFILPELSLPINWVESVSKSLLKSGISLIAGTEYRHSPNSNIIYSQAYLNLTDNRLGFPSSVKIWQDKKIPAPAEESQLIAIHGKEWKATSNERPIYVHNDFHFGVMVCSELQNSKARVDFQGKIDALMVLAWNQDLETFSALVESAALDIHAYTILVNNRKYGDSRVRSPDKESFKRDLARVRGGKNDFCVSVELDISKLRAFQSRAKRWPSPSDPFKPVPEGFELIKSRVNKPAI